PNPERSERRRTTKIAAFPNNSRRPNQVISLHSQRGMRKWTLENGHQRGAKIINQHHRSCLAQIEYRRSYTRRFRILELLPRGCATATCNNEPAIAKQLLASTIELSTKHRKHAKHRQRR